jgi:Fe-Mn family superoxide dismutase
MSIYSNKANQTGFPFILPKLPYEKDGLSPYLTPETMDFHHTKHHNTYVVNLNKLLETSDLKTLSLEDIIHHSSREPDMKPIFNNAAQIWNHSFYWHSMKPNGGGEPSGNLIAKIEEDFGSFAKFKDEFSAAALSQFGSGWAWLVLSSGKLKITKSANAETPFTEGHFPIITCDVWEHAYYIDYRNRRADYVTIFLNHLVNWEFAEENFNNAI